MHYPSDPRKAKNENDNSSFEIIPDDEGELTEEDFDFEGEDESLYDDFDLDMNTFLSNIPWQWFNRSVPWILN